MTRFLFFLLAYTSVLSFATVFDKAVLTTPNCSLLLAHVRKSLRENFSLTNRDSADHNHEHFGSLPKEWTNPQKYQGKVFLDIGCGYEGKWVTELRGHGVQAYGIDPAITSARENEFLLPGLAQHLPIKNESIDIATNLHSIFSAEYILDQSDVSLMEALNEAHRVLKKNGTLILGSFEKHESTVLAKRKLVRLVTEHGGFTIKRISDPAFNLESYELTKNP